MYKLLLHNIHSTPYSIAFADDGIFLVFKCWADDVALVSQAHAVKSELIAHEVDECSRFIRTFMPLPSNLNDLFQPKILFLHQYNHIKPTQMHTMHSKCLFLWDYIWCLYVFEWMVEVLVIWLVLHIFIDCRSFSDRKRDQNIIQVSSVSCPFLHCFQTFNILLQQLLFLCPHRLTK